MIHIDQLIVERQGKTICRLASLEVPRGQRVGIVGSNGSGKTTLLRVLAGLEGGIRGRCQVAAARRERVLVHQDPFLFRGSVLENVTYGLRAHHVPRGQRLRIAHHWLDRLGIAHLAARRTNHLSGGERHRTALARALALRPKLLLLDEPFSDLDAQGSATIQEILGDLGETTVVLASPTELPDGVAMETVYLETGKGG